MEHKKRIRTRSWYKENGIQIEPTKVKENYDNFPFVKFYGEIKYYHTFEDIALTTDQLLEQINNSTENVALGFDMEWPFSFKTGPGKTALIQICANKRVCFLLQITSLKKLPAALVFLLAHERVKLCGVNIRNDIHKLARDFPEIPKEKILSNCVDSRSQAKEVSDGVSWSMEKLVNRFLKMRIDKDKKIRMSQWYVIPLSGDQQMYAATDAYISLVLYQHLQSLKRRMLTENNLKN